MSLIYETDTSPTGQFTYYLDILPTYFLECEVVTYALKMQQNST